MVTTCEPTCNTTGEWIVSTSPATTSPYYSPSTNSQLAPIPNRATSPSNPSGVAPSPVPADRRPALDPTNRQINGGGSASHSNTANEVFVHTIEPQESTVELVAPRVSSEAASDESEAKPLREIPPLLEDIPGNKTAGKLEDTSQLVPVSWSTPTKTVKPTIPTDRVWDDSGWQSER